MPPILPKKHDDMVFKKEVTRQLRNNATSQLVTPAPYPASPYGGNGPPDASWYVPVTIGTFSSTQPGQPWIVAMDSLFKLGFRALIPWITDATTPGEVRLAIYAPTGTVVTGVVALPGGSSGTLQFMWLHGLEPYTLEDVWVYIEARRVSGAGNVKIGFPYGGGMQVGPEGCTVTGL